MITMLLSEIAKACDGRLVGADCQISSVSTDSRHIDEQGLLLLLSVNALMLMILYQQYKSKEQLRFLYQKKSIRHFLK